MPGSDTRQNGRIAFRQSDSTRGRSGCSAIVEAPRTPLLLLLPAMEGGMTFPHCDEGATAGRANFSVGAQGAVDRRSIIG